MEREISIEQAIEIALKYQEAGRSGEAEGLFRQVLALSPGHPVALTNLAAILSEDGRFTESLATNKKALDVAPPWVAELHWNIALILLLLGDYERGWAEYEWRWKCKDHHIGGPRFVEPQWDGSPLQGKTILLHTEQGLGDAIQFVRFAPKVASAGGRVLLGCPSSLFRLMQGVTGVEQVVRTQPLPHFDVQCPLMTLPLVFGTRVDSIPAQVPYLQVNPELARKWGDKLGPPNNRLRVGLTWAGGPGYKNDRKRSIALSALAPLIQVAGIAWFSLQKGPTAAEAQQIPPGTTWIDFTADLDDFADTAALMSQLDLIISVDTAVAHLAGALGKPVWVLIPSKPDWRWLLDREDSPWYPTMRLFRQKNPGDWTQVIERVALALTIASASHSWQ